MNRVERSFEKLLGRQPSEKEVQRLYRVKEALGLRDNDALWLVLIALESYDSLYRKYPEMVGAQVSRSIEAQRVAIAAIAASETQRALGTLADAVSRSSETIASRLVMASWLQWCGLAMLGLVVFGTFCILIGFVLGSGHMPFWAPPSEQQSFSGLLISTLARTPAGWLGAVIGLGFGLAGLWHARREILFSRGRALVAPSVLLALVALIFLWPLL